MPHSLRSRWTTSLAALATLLSTATGVGVIAAPAASASTGIVFDGGSLSSSYSTWQITASSSCNGCMDQVAQSFTAAAGGPVTKVVLRTYTSGARSTVEIRSTEAYPSPGGTLVASQIAPPVYDPSSATTTYFMSGGQVTSGQSYELLVSADPDSYTNLGVEQSPGGVYSGFAIHYSSQGWYSQGYYTMEAQVFESDGADAPTISMTVSPSSPDGDNGWYKTAPTVHFDCADDRGVTFCPADYTVPEGDNPAHVVSTDDDSSNVTDYTVPEIKVDTTRPTVTIGVDNVAAAAAKTYNPSTHWYLSTPDFTGGCGDAVTCTTTFMSHPSYPDWYCTSYGAAYCPQPITGGYGHWLRTGTDAAGNTSTAQTADVNLNPGTPTISGTVYGVNDAGWGNGNSAIYWSCSSTYTSVNCPGWVGLTETPIGGSQFSGTVTDASGKTATATVTAQVDTTPPTLTPTIDGTQGQNGWYTSPVTVAWTCADALSGPKSCSDPQTLNNEDNNAFGYGTDVADNWTGAAVEIKSDSTPPVITGTVVTTKGYGGGVYDEPITVHWTCSDAVSGMGSCPTDTTVTGIGTDTVAHATALDSAGNPGVGTVPGLFRRVDAPAITVTGALNAHTYAFGTTVTPSCTAVSGSGDPVRCSGTVEGGSDDGSGVYVYTVTATDPITHLSSVKTVQWIIAERPAVSLIVSNVLDQASYAYGTAIRPSCQATDADGVAVTCTGRVTGGKADGSGLFNYVATAADPITGKVSAARVTWTVGSKPAPRVAVVNVPTGNALPYGTKVSPGCVAADADQKSLPCEGAVSSHKLTDGSTGYLYTATTTDPANGLMSAASATWTIAAPGQAVIGGLPRKLKSGHPVVVAGKAYPLSISFAGSTTSELASAPYWLKPVKTDVKGKAKPSVIAGMLTPVHGGYRWTFTPSKAMRGSYRELGIEGADGVITYLVVYVK